MTQNLIVVGVFDNDFEAEIAMAHLEAEDIESNIFKTDAGGMFPSLQITEGVQLVVAEEFAERAKQILDEKLRDFEE
jgi:hypothetical protein